MNAEQNSEKSSEVTGCVLPALFTLLGLPSQNT
jgi:hypothetical protein